MANCINYKSKDFIELVNQLGLPEGVLAAKIANWQEINGIDNWPTASDLGYNSKFNNSSLPDSNSNIKPGVAELFESNPELANAVYEAAGFKKNLEYIVNKHNTNDDVLIKDKIIVTEELQNIKVNNYDGSINTDYRIIRERANEVAVGDTIDISDLTKPRIVTINDVLERFTISDENKHLLEKLKPIIEDVKIEYIRKNILSNAVGMYSDKYNTIRLLDINSLPKYERPDISEQEIFFHELLHAATFRKIVYFEEGKQGLSKNELVALNELENIRKILKELGKESLIQTKNKGIIINPLYGYSTDSIHEIISYAFTNREFRNTIADIPYKGSKSILDKLIELIANIFGSKENTVLNALLANTEVLLENNQITPQQKQQAQELYSKYLNTIFPDSKVKDIVYHGSNERRDYLDPGKQVRGRFGKGVSFASTIKLVKQLIDDAIIHAAIIDLKNPLTDIPDTRAEVQPSVEAGNHDGVQVGKIEYTVPTKEQIHILGSKQDIEGFKEFVNKGQIKPGVSELFESNPEFVNEVYEALGFKIKYYDKSWKDGSNVNKAKSFALKDKPSEIFELVEDKENGYYSVHFKTTKKDSLTNEEKQKLVQIVASNIPVGGKLSTWGTVTKGGFAGLNRFLQEGFIKTYETRDSGGNLIPVYEKINKSNFEQQAQQLYSQYLDTIFPNSKVKDIVYHGSMDGIEEFKNPYEHKNNIHSTFQFNKKRYGIYFTPIFKEAKEYASTYANIRKIPKVYTVLLNMENPHKGRDVIFYGASALKNVAKLVNKNYKNFQDLTENDVNDFNKSNIDSIEWIGKNQYIVFNPNQIHILGSKQDIEGFKEFVNNNNFLQKFSTNTQSANAELNQILTKFLDNIGVKVEVLGEGDFVAKAKIVDKIIQVVQGKADITTLPEEAAHFFVEMLDKNGTIIKQLLTNIENDPLYSQTFEEYKTIYKLPDGSPDIEKIKREAVGKKLAREIVSLFKSGAIQQQKVSEEINNRSIFMRAWNMITALIKKALNKTGITNFSSYLKNEDITTNIYENVARNILTNDISSLELNQSLNDYEMLQASNVTATEIKESLEKFQNRIETGSDKVGNETRHFYTIDKGSENERVIYGTPSLLASQMSRKKSKYRTVSDREKVLWEKIAARGTKVHSWVEECVRANINQYDATSSTLYSGLSDIEKKTFRGVKSQVDLLIKHINEQDPGSIFMTEVGVIDSRMQWLDDNNKSKYGIAGRIDLLVIHPDGTVSIYDWKTTSNKKDLYGIKAFKFFEYLKQVALYKRILMNGDIRYGIPKVKGIRKSRIVQIDTLSDNNDNITQANVVGQIPISGESTGDSIASKNLNHKLETMYEKLEKMIASKPPKDEIERKLFYERMNNLKDTIVDLQLKSNYKKVISNATNDLNYVNTLITQDDLNIDDLREAQEIIDLYTDILEYSDKNDMTPEIRQSFRMISERANELKSIISTKSQEILQLQADNYNIGNLEQTQREVGFLEKNFRSISQVNHPLIAYLHEITKRALYETELESNNLRKEIFEHRDKLAKWASSKGMSIQEAYNLIVNKKTGNLISKYNKNYYDLIEKAISNNNPKVLENTFYIDMAAYNEALEKYKKSIANRVFTTNVAANKSIIDQSIKDYESANTNILTSKFRKVKPDKEDEFLSNEWKVLNSPNNKELKEFYDFFTSKTKELSAWLPNYGYKSNFIPAVRRTFIDEVMRLNNAAATSIYKKVVDKFNPSAVSVNLGSIHGNGEIGGEVPLYFVNGLSADEKSYDLSHVLQLFGEMSYNHKNMSQIETSALAGLNLIQNQKSYERSSTSPLGLVRSNTTANFKVSEEANKGWVEMYKDFMNYFVYDIKTKNPSSLTQFLDTLNQYTAFKYLGLSIFPALAATTANIANTQVQISKNVYFGNKEFSKAIWLLSGGRAMSSKDKDIAYALLEAIDPVIDIRTNAKDRKLKNNIVNRHATSEHFYAMLRKPDELNQKAVTLALLQKSTIDDKGNIVLMSKYLQDLKPFDYYSYPKGSKERNQMDAVIAEKSKNLKSVMDMASLDDKGNLLLDGKVLDKESILQFRQLSRQVNKNIIGNVDPNDIATYKVNAWARSLFLFRNWLPRAIDERYGEVRFNRELNSYEMGRYRTTFNHLFTFIKDEYNNSKWSLLVGVEEAAKAQYYKQLQLRPELEGNLSLNEFVDLYKQNLRASIKGLAITAGVLMLLIIAGKAYDDDDEVTPGEKFTLKVLNRSYTELMMFVNPIEALNILKSPSAATAPLSDLFKVFQHGSMEVFGAVTGDEDYQKRAKPLKYIMTFNPLYGPEKVYREFDESWKDMIEGNENN